MDLWTLLISESIYKILFFSFVHQLIEFFTVLKILRYKTLTVPTRNGDYASRLIADTVFLLLIHFAIYCSVNKLQGKSFLYWA